MSDSKKCTKCGETKTLEEIVKGPNKSGYRAECLVCHRAACMRRYRLCTKDSAYREKLRKETRERMRERLQDPVYREQERERVRKRRTDPRVVEQQRKQVRERRREQVKDPIYREKYREMGRKFQQKSWQDPAYREKQRRLMVMDPQRRMLSSSKRRAKICGFSHTIAKSDIPLPTIYCPAIDVVLTINTDMAGPNSPSLDRIDSARGYEVHNIAVISQLANSIKGKRTPEQLYKRAKNILFKSEKLTGALQEHQRYEAWLTFKVARYSENALAASRLARYVEEELLVEEEDEFEVGDLSNILTG